MAQQGQAPGPLSNRLHDGTFLQIGVRHQRYDRAHDRFLVDCQRNVGTPEDPVYEVFNDEASLRDAIQQAILQRGIYHHQIGNLELESVRATKFGTSRAWVTMQYARGRWSTPTRDATKSIAIRTAMESVSCYRLAYNPGIRGTEVQDPPDPDWMPPVINPDTGLPCGIVNHPNNNDDPSDDVKVELAASQPPEPIPWRVPILRLYVKTILNFNPFRLDGSGGGDNIFQYVNKTNSMAIAFGDRVWAPNEIRFDGAEVEWAADGLGYGAGGDNGDHFVIYYAFSGRPGGWLHQEPVFNRKDVIEDLAEPDVKTLRVPDHKLENEGENKWTVVDVETYTKVNMIGAFPIHVPIP